LYHIKNDQRSVRSAETILKALTRLISRQSYDSIKVSELVAEADVGRATFYRNFDMLEDVLRWRCDLVMDDLFDYVNEYRRTANDSGLMPVLKPVLRFFYLHSSIVELLLAAERIDILQLALQRKMELGEQQESLAGVPAQYLTYGRIIHANAAVQILAHWVQTGKKEPPDMLADGLNNMMLEMSRARAQPVNI